MGEFVVGLLLFVGGLLSLRLSRAPRRPAVAASPVDAEQTSSTGKQPKGSAARGSGRFGSFGGLGSGGGQGGSGTFRGGMIGKLVGAAMTVVGAVMLFGSFLYTQDVGEAVVIRTPGGTIGGVDTTPGFSFKAPWNDAVRFDVRNQIITMAGEGGASDGPAINAQTSDNATAAIDITIRYSIVPSEVGQIYQQYRTQASLVDRALDVDVRSIVRDIPVKYTAGELRQKRTDVAADMAKALQDRWSKLGVTVDSVDLRDIRYSQEIESSLAAVQTARSRVESARAELESAKINAEKVKTEAQAQSDSDQIIRCGATSSTVKEIIAGKEVTTVKVVPVPPAQCQNRLNEQVLTNKYIDMLKEAAARGNTIYVVPPSQNSILQFPAPTPTKTS